MSPVLRPSHPGPHRAPRLLLLALALVLALSPVAAHAALPDRALPGSFVAGGGILAGGAHAVVLTVDAELLLPPIMLGYRYGLLDGLELGAEAGGDAGLFQALLAVKTRLVERDGGYWGLRLRTGYKTHDWVSGEIVFDDHSWIVSLEHVAALRPEDWGGLALYVTSVAYLDIDLRTPRRQTDVYLAPASLGLEARLGRRLSLFFEVGFVIGLNGTQTHRGLLYVSDLFPIGKLGLGLLL